MTALEENDTKALEAEDDEWLAYYWTELNTGVHSEYFTCKPERIWAVMCWIQDRIGIKNCLRMWNASNMDDENFDAWWDGRKTADQAMVDSHPEEFTSDIHH